MAGTVNKAILIGRLGKDPETKFTQGGVAIARFSLATDESWKDQNGEQQQRTEWHNVVAWRRLAEICGQYLIKGKLVYIEGRLQTRSWEDKEGNKRTTTEIQADKMVMLSGGKPEEDSETSRQSIPTARQSIPTASSSENEITDDDIPF
jgi:single-strand DNA-binding protein